LELSLAKREKREFLLISARLLEVFHFIIYLFQNVLGAAGQEGKIPLCTAGS
jgi:hypothetical protein